jgi:uncharacterized damage-inducible protein DinB
MTEVERIVDQLNRAVTGGAWHGAAVEEILAGITAEQAATRPFNGAHNIWEIALHISSWLQAGSRRLAGDRAQLTDTEDWPAITDSSEQAWKEANAQITQAYVALSSAIGQLRDSSLDQPILEDMSSVYVTLHGVIQHTLYHAGQIAILKKAILERQTT